MRDTNDRLRTGLFVGLDSRAPRAGTDHFWCADYDKARNLLEQDGLVHMKPFIRDNPVLGAKHINEWQAENR